MTDNTNARTRAIGALAELFYGLMGSGHDFARIESDAIDLAHNLMASAFSLALESKDNELLARRPSTLSCHDIRRRTLASEFGDITFDIRRYRDRFGCDVYLLADALDIPYGTRLTPAATDFLVEAAVHVSYAKAASLLGRHGSVVKSTTVMNTLRQVGLLCANEDQAKAESLYRDGVLPEAELESDTLCIEADGTFFSLQSRTEGQPRRAEVKAMVAYGGKACVGGKVRRQNCVHHALIGTPEELWSQGVATLGQKYDLSKIERVYLGGDGEKWCRGIDRYLPRAHTHFALDPFHINRAVLSCFSEPKAAWKILDALYDGDKEGPIALLEACAGIRYAKPKQVKDTVSYLRNNIDHIASNGPSLGTMESENQHLYGIRMDSFPCAWSMQGASDMARLISRNANGTKPVRLSREQSVGTERRRRRERKELEYYERQGGSGRVVQSVGHGYLPPHQADTKNMPRGKAYALHAGMAALGRGI